MNLLLESTPPYHIVVIMTVHKVVSPENLDCLIAVSLFSFAENQKAGENLTDSWHTMK